MAGWEYIDGVAYWLDDNQVAHEQAPDGSVPPADQSQASYPDDQTMSYGGGGGAPAYVPPQPDPSLIPVGMDSASTSTSSSGSSTPQAAINEFETDVNAKSAQVEQDVNAQANQAASDLRGASLDQQRKVIGDEAYATAPSMYDVQAAAARENVNQQARLAEMQARLIQTEQVAQAAAERHVAQVGADYMGQVQQFAAMRVNPGQWWGNLSQGEQAGTLASVFVANFLGMRGRNTPVMATINQAIDRNMDAQSQNIAQAGQVASMYKTVYDMAVAQSETSEEARARMRGFYIAQLQQDIAVELGRYDAPLAQAKAAEARAALDMEFEKNLANLKATWWDRGMTAKQLIVEQEKAKLQASHKSYARSQSQAYGKEKMVPGAGGSQYDEANLAFNPRTDKPYGSFLKGTSPKTRSDINGLAAASRGLTRNVDKLKIMVAKNGGIYKPEWFSDEVLDEAGTEIRSLLTMVAADYAIAMNGGSRPSDFDVKNAFKVVPLQGWLTRADPESTYNMLINVAEDKYNDLAAVHVRQFQTDEERAWASSYTGARPDVSADHVAGTRTGAPEPRGGEIDTFVGLAHSKQANNAKENPDPALVSKWGKLKSDFPFPQPDAPPVWSYALDEIADGLGHSDPERQAQAREALEAYAAKSATAEDYDNGAREAWVKLLLSGEGN